MSLARSFRHPAVLKMPPTRVRLSLKHSLRPLLPIRPRHAAYSTDAEPVVRVTDLAAPNTSHIRILELNRPAARNAISRELLYSLRDQIDAVHAQYDTKTGAELPAARDSAKGPTRALILASAVDTSFCAGADLKERRGFTQAEYARLDSVPQTTGFNCSHPGC